MSEKTMTQEKMQDLSFFHLKKPEWYKDLKGKFNMDHPDLIPVCSKGHSKRVIVRDSFSKCICKECSIPFSYDSSPEQQRNYALVLVQSSLDSAVVRDFDLSRDEILKMQKKAARILESLPKESLKTADLALLSDLYQRQAENLESIGEENLALKAFQNAWQSLKRMEREKADLNSIQIGEIEAVGGLLQIKILRLLGKLDYPAEEIDQAITAGILSFQCALSVLCDDENENKEDIKDQIQEDQDSQSNQSNQSKETKKIQQVLQEAMAEFYLEAARIFEQKGECQKALEYYLKTYEQAFPDGKPLEKFEDREHRLYKSLPSFFKLTKKSDSLSNEKLISILTLWMEHCMKSYDHFYYENEVHYTEDFLNQIYYGARYLLDLNEKDQAVDWLDRALEKAKKAHEEKKTGIERRPLLLAEALYYISELYHQAGKEETERKLFEKVIEFLSPWADIWHLFEDESAFAFLAFFYNRLAAACVFDSFNVEEGIKAAKQSLDYCSKALEGTGKELKLEIKALEYLDYTCLSLLYSVSDEKRAEEMIARRDKVKEQIKELAKERSFYSFLLDEEQFHLESMKKASETILMLADWKKLGSTSNYEGLYELFDELNAAF